MTHKTPLIKDTAKTIGDKKYLLNENVSFVQHFIPGLEAGEYQLQLHHEVQDSNKKPVDGAAYTSSYTFAVRADRFSLSHPSQTIKSVFPNNLASGEYSTVLPHVVFSQKTFPWIRYPSLKPPFTQPDPGKDTDIDVPTWLWVMILDEDDVSACTQQKFSLDLVPHSAIIGDLFSPQAVSQSTLSNNYSYFNGETSTGGLDVGETIDNPIKVIDVPLKFFWQIAPTLKDLELMAHGRKVSLVKTSQDQEDVEEPIGTFSVVMGNRLPNTNKTTHAYLVSLEGLESFLPHQDGSPPTVSYNDTYNLRLAVLKHWTFFSTGEPATFVHKLESLNQSDTSNTNLRLSYKGTNQLINEACNMGFVPLNETLRTSESTVSWYRGPLSPYSIAKSSKIIFPIPSSDAVTAFDPTTGMFDVSYACAWTLGRMLALQDKGFSVELYNWKHGLTQSVINSIEESLIKNTIGTSISNLAKASIESKKDLVTHFLQMIVPNTGGKK